MSSVALDFLESKLRPPWARAGLVTRTSLIDQLLEAEAPLIAVVAPPGYGKTTLLSQMQQRSPLRTAWVSLDERDNDPAVLFSYLSSALEQVAQPSPDSQRRAAALGSDRGSSLRRLAVMVSSVPESFSLVLDHVEAVQSQASRDALAELALNVPPGSRVALASRNELPLPMARLRARGSVFDVGMDDLAMGELEARELLTASGIEIENGHFEDLRTRTEGWPAGLYLASLAIKSGARQTDVGVAFHGHDRLMADYLRSEVMSTLPPETARFLTRTAVLDRLCGPLCDAVMGMPGSQQVLEALAASNLLLVPLDRQGTWYRCHHLFRDLLQAELGHSEPEAIPRLHDRAAGWFEANGHEDYAIDHALAAGDADRAARLITVIGHRMFTSGCIETMLAWLDWLDQRDLIARHRHLAVLGALAESVEGNPRKAEQWAAAARSGDSRLVLPDGSTSDSWISVLDAYTCRRGIAQMRADAESALANLAPRSPWRSGAEFFAAMSYLLEGDDETADLQLAESVEVSLQVRAMPIAARSLAERAVVAIDRHDWAAADSFAREALAIVEDEHFETFLDSTIVFAVAARTAAHRGQVDRAKRYLTLASRLRPKCTSFFAISAQFLVQIAHGFLEVADPAGAQAVLDQVHGILEVRPDMGTVVKQVGELEQMLEAIRVETLGASTLTAAELRLLPLLATHLSMAEIGERLFVSKHTVKSQAISAYRKLGVSARSSAIQRAEEIGLLSR